MTPEQAERIASALEGIEISLRRLVDPKDGLLVWVREIGDQLDAGAARPRIDADRGGKRVRLAEIEEWERMRADGETWDYIATGTGRTAESIRKSVEYHKHPART